LKGVTSNTSSFEKALGETDEYAEALNQFQAQSVHSISEIYEQLAIVGIRSCGRRAASSLRADSRPGRQY
jgi:transaldolase/glucose-6-phosphate isomerase